MTPAQRRYLATEVAIGAAINAALSVGFVLLLFGGEARVPVRGLALDALPQTFAVALMSTLVPTWLTRRRVRAGSVAGSPANGRGYGMALQTLGIAVGTAVLAGAVHWLLLPRLTPPEWRLGVAIAYKAAYGALLGAVLTALAVRAALRK